MEDHRTTSILSESFKQNIMKVALRVRNDISFVSDLGIIALAFFTGLLLFWWVAGKSAFYTYAQNWMTLYPGVPLNESFMINIFIIADHITEAIIVIVWVFAVIYLTIMVYTDPKRIRAATPEVTVSDPTSLKTECPHCNSPKTRKAGKKHPDKRYCLSCKRYFR